jgi:hypothetical protein
MLDKFKVVGVKVVKMSKSTKKTKISFRLPTLLTSTFGH